MAEVVESAEVFEDSLIAGSGFGCTAFTDRLGEIVHFIGKVKDRALCHLDHGVGALLQRLDDSDEIRSSGGFYSPRRKIFLEQLGQTLTIAGLDIVGIQPQQLFGIEDPGGTTDMIKIEFGDQLLHRKDLFIAAGPAEARQIVHKRFR